MDRKTNNKQLKSLDHVLRTTNFIFRKNRPPSHIEVTGLPTFHSARNKKQVESSIKNRSLKKKHNSLQIESPSEISCTNFMKNYIDKLKKERKRHNKKIKESNALSLQKKKNQFQGLNVRREEPLYNRPQSNQILILERIPKNGVRGLNTISLVSQNLDDFNYPNQFKNKRLPEQPEWANQERIDKLIKDIRNSRNKNLVLDEISQISHLINNEEEDQKQKILMNTTLPNLNGIQKRQRFKTIKKPPIKKGRPQEINYKNLEPWKQQNNLYQFSIEEYSEKQ